MPLKRGEVTAALVSKGFVLREGDHSHYTYHTERGMRTSVRTKTSHGRKNVDIDDGLLSRMAKQCRLSNRQFREFVDCSLSRHDYESALVANDVLQDDEVAEEGDNAEIGRARQNR